MALKRILLGIVVFIVLSAPVLAQPSNRGYTFHSVQVMDELGRKDTSITSVDIYTPATTASQTIYADRALANAITLPMTSATANTTLVDGYFTWWGADGYDYTITDGTRTLNNAFGPAMTGSVGTIVMPTWIQVISSSAYTDAQSITLGTSSDWVINAGTTADLITFTPATDGAVFRVGVSGTTANADLQWYTGTGEGVIIDEGASTLGITGLTTSINAASNFATNINTGTSTGAVTIGSSTAGTIVVDTTSTVSVNADGAILLTTTDAAANISLIPALGSVIIQPTEASADDALVLQTVGAGSGIQITSLADIDIITTGADGEDISLINTGGSVWIEATEAAADAITLKATTAAGGIDIASQADIDITTTGADGEDITITNTGGSIVITATEDHAGAIQLVTNGGTSEELNLTNTLGTAVTAIDIDATAGGVQITAVADIEIALVAGTAGEDILITSSGAADSSITITSAGTEDDAISLNTTAGGINIVMAGGAAGEDFEITTATSIDFSTSETAADQFKVDATGAIAGNAINLETTSGGIILTADGATAGDIQIDAQDKITIISTSTAAAGVDLETNGSTSDTVHIHNNQGTGQTSIDILSDVGGVTVTSTATPDQLYALKSSGSIAGETRSEGLGLYVEGNITGNVDGPTYASGHWLNITSGTPTGSVLAGMDVGVYESGGTLASVAHVVGLQVQLQLDSTSTAQDTEMMRFNCDYTAGHKSPDYWFQAGNQAAVAFTPNTASAGTKVGAIKVLITGTGVCYFWLYNDYK